MTSDHANHKAAYDDLNIRSIVLVGGVGSILVFVAVVAVQVIYFRYEDSEYARKVLDAPDVAAETILASQTERLGVPGDGANVGEKSIPISVAMKAVVAEYQERRPSDTGTDANPSRADSAE